MEEKKSTKRKKKGEVAEAQKTTLPVIRGLRLRARGRIFQGVVTKKLPGRVTIVFERMIRIPKYERYEKRKTKIHARLPEALSEQVDVGCLVEVSETRPISKMIHFIVTDLIRGTGGNHESSK